MKKAGSGLRWRLNIAQVNRAIVQHQIVQRPLRVLAAARLRLGRIAARESTVVIVNWNSRDFLDVTLRAVELYSPRSTRILVVDNHSSDGSRSLVESYPCVKWLSLPRNVGHELALDIGFLLSRTEFVIALDVDAFPISAQWIDRLVGPLQDGYCVSGAHLRNGFVHPCCLAMRLERFVSRKHTFLARRGSGRLADNAEDIRAKLGYGLENLVHRNPTVSFRQNGGRRPRGHGEFLGRSDLPQLLLDPVRNEAIGGARRDRNRHHAGGGFERLGAGRLTVLPGGDVPGR